ncbi:MAG: HPr-rel-A system PqqD family peptide chaperone [bacterium]
MNKQLTDIAVSEAGFVFDPSSGQTYRLNKTGVGIVRLLQNGVGSDEIAQRLSMEFDIDKESAKEDVREFISLLKEMGFRVEYA